MADNVSRREALQTAAALGAAAAVAGLAAGAEPAKPPVKVAFVGVGHIHTPDFANRLKNRADVRCVAVWDHDAARAKSYGERLGCPVAAERREILANPEIAAVLVCSETNRHEELVLEAAAAHKHIFAEKPLGLGARDAYAMADAVEKAGVLFSTGYAMRSDGVNLFVKDQVAKGNFGTITRVRKSVCHSGSLGGWFDGEYRWMADLKQAGVGGFGDLGTHGLDILLWWFGDVARVTASIHAVTHRYGDTDEFGEGILEFTNGVVATLAAGWLDLADPLSFQLSGNEGFAYQSGGALHFRSNKVPGADGKQPWTELPAGRPHAFEVFLNAVCGQPDQPLITVREAAKRAAVMEALYTAAREHTWVVPA